MTNGAAVNGNGPSNGQGYSPSGETAYIIHLPQFEGPFDLLLFFIQRDELDIYDIPIAQITHDFLAYIREAERLQINLASEFIVVAAQLMKIKSRLLLPRPQVNEEGEVEDPRQELIDRLVAYQQYKHAVEELQTLAAQAHQRAERGYVAQEAQIVKQQDGPTDDLVALTVYDLFKAYRRVLDRQTRTLSTPQHVIRLYPYTAEEMRERVWDRVLRQRHVSFEALLQEEPNRFFLVFCFLTILEMAHQGHLKLVLGEGYNNFWLQRRLAAEEEAQGPES
jgi:segregation and condensation protein A